MGDAMAALATRLAEDPDDAEGWRLLARSYSAVGADARAVEAYEKLLALLPNDLEATGDLAESRVYDEGGLVTTEAASGFARVLEATPSDPRARYYIALKAAQDGESENAIRQWAGILRDAEPNAPYLQAIWQIIDATIADEGLDAAALDLPDRPSPELAALPPGPTAEDVAAAAEMSDSDQLDMIRSMVARLEERLIQEPGDIDGWLRLARSRTVLGEADQAAAALRAAMTVNPGEPRLAAALLQLNGGE
jgi:cytochrome c-type biogenesis protein CcmH